MDSVTAFLENNLKLTVNRQKSEVGSPTKRKVLGFCLHTTKDGVGFRPHFKSKKKFEKKLREKTSRKRSGSIRHIMKEVNEVTTGWITYYGISYMKGYIQRIDQWLRPRMRQVIWKRWKKVQTKYRYLVKLKISRQKAWEWANTRKGYWRIACSHILHRTIGNDSLEKAGLKNLNQLFKKAHSTY
ncbi:Group II intron, maturase-specific domain [Salimicrobium flavidum]|uniref:Group II intron, maturase-specific domain n=1 Tax=Salimicrobium flavidum TaxID=570947 RepID=A0A1N7IZJ6_9BACI|nr:Group II intron, maturase-specific domain [Salimicrobium flavidum]